MLSKINHSVISFAIWVTAKKRLANGVASSLNDIWRILSAQVGRSIPVWLLATRELPPIANTSRTSNSFYLTRKSVLSFKLKVLRHQFEGCPLVGSSCHLNAFSRRFVSLNILLGWQKKLQKFWRMEILLQSFHLHWLIVSHFQVTSAMIPHVQFP